MCFMVFLSCGSCYLVGDTLGISAIRDQGQLLYGKVPYPPIANDQLGVLCHVKILEPLQKVILEGLKQLIQSKQPQCWTTIFLSVFMLLHNCSVLTWDRYRHARKHGSKVRSSEFARVIAAYVTDTQILVEVYLATLRRAVAY